MSVAELKRRLVKGVRLRLVEHPGRPGVDEVRQVELVQTNAIAFGEPGCKRSALCWLWWARGLRVETTAGGFKLLWPNGNFLRYEWLSDAPAMSLAEVKRRRAHGMGETAPEDDAALAAVLDQIAPPIAGSADVERESKLDAERVTLEFGSRSTRKLDAGRRPFDESPLFGGEKQERMF